MKVLITAFEVNDADTLTTVPELNPELRDGSVGFDISWTEDEEYPVVVAEDRPFRSRVRVCRADQEGRLDGTLFIRNADSDLLGLNSISSKRK